MNFVSNVEFKHEQQQTGSHQLSLKISKYDVKCRIRAKSRNGNVASLPNSSAAARVLRLLESDIFELEQIGQVLADATNGISRIFLLLLLSMQVIMVRLSTHMNALLTIEILGKLNARRIFTVLDFIQEDPEKLVPTTKLSYKEILNIRNSLIENYSAFPCHGTDAYNDCAANSAIVPTGIVR